MLKKEKYLKLILLIFNITFSLCGLLVLFQASLTFSQDAPYLEFVGSKFKAPLITLIVTSCCFCAIGILGCIVTFKENYLAQFVVASAIFLLLLAQVCTFIVGLSLMRKLTTDVQGNMLKVMHEYSNDQMDRLDEIQRNLKCCGVTSFTDWHVQVDTSSNWSVPLSCCCSNTTDPKLCTYPKFAQGHPSTVHGIHVQGCGELVVNYVSRSRISVDVACAISMVVEISCLVGLCYFLWKDKVSKVLTYEAVLTKV
ncbi:tetraspanin-36-like [Apostichopus japonicus]|uniref:tetraspanin-36-like n=1 Tax=Stichopus japonicus TaxID=307972 RepID=UPI003AB334CB